MLLPRSAPVFAAAALGLAFSATFSAGMTSDIPQNCAVTLPSESISDPIPANRMGIASDGKVWAYGTKKLWTLLPVDGVWRGLKPRQPGDFAYSNKLPWGGYFRDDDGPLTVTGKRLDGPAPAFVNTEEIGGFPDGDEHAAIMGGIDIPLFGCWQITGHYTDQDLTFTVWVMPLPEEEASLLPVAQEQPSAWNMPPRRIHVDGAEEAKSLVYRVIPGNSSRSSGSEYFGHRGASRSNRYRRKGARIKVRVRTATAGAGRDRGGYLVGIQN